jgi:ribonuclease E
MAKKMLIDATHAEETRVVVADGNKVEEFDFETINRRQLAGNIYLAKITRVEPSLQAAFVDYGGNRHGFLAFAEIHPDYYQIPVADREALIEEERQLAEAAEAEEDKPKPTRRRRSRRPAKAEKATNDEAVVSSDEIPGMAIVDHEADDAQDGDAAQAVAAPVETDDAAQTVAADVPAEDAPVAEAPVADEADSDASDDESSDDSDDDAQDDDDSDAAERAVDSGIESIADEDVQEEMRTPRKARARRYKIQEVIKVRQIMLVQVVKEERGNKGAALTTYLSLAGRYCVLMPNTARGGGISRKITNAKDRKRLKSILAELEIPGGMAVIVRTAGAERTKAEIKRDFDYLMRLWDRIRETTLQSQAPCLIYEEADLIKRSIRDLYARDVDEVLVEGDDGYRVAKDFMKMLMPSHAKRVQPYKDQGVPLFHRFQVESQLDAMLNPVVQLKSGGYIVINPTEALVAVDVNSGRSTRERNIEETAYKTNLEAAEELSRQLRLRDLAGLIVVDFIDMEDHRNQASVERKLKEAMRNDRARLQIGRISPFGLLEMSRQRLRPSLVESAFEVCAHCRGVGLVRSIESAALHLLRVIEEEGMRKRSGALTVHVASEVALYILNRKRDSLAEIEQRYGFTVMIFGDDSLISPDYRIERTRAKKEDAEDAPAVLNSDSVSLSAIEAPVEKIEEDDDQTSDDSDDNDDQGGKRRRRRRRRRGRNDDRDTANDRQDNNDGNDDDDTGNDNDRHADGNDDNDQDGDDDSQRKRRRRGKRGGRRRSRRQDFEGTPRNTSPADDADATAERRNRPHNTDDANTPDSVIDAESDGQDADSFDNEGVSAARSRSTTAPAPARQRRERRDRNDRRNKRDNRDNRDRGEVRNIPIQSGPAPEAVATPEAAPQTEVENKPQSPAPSAAAKAPKPAETSVPASAPANDKAENAEPVKSEAKPEATPAPAETAAPESAPAKPEKPKARKRGWWNLGK